jgi:hypothetical protein
MSTESTIYDLTPAQAGLNHFYELHLCALTSRKYHGVKHARLRRQVAIAEAAAALSSSSAIASLYFWRQGVGVAFFGVLSGIAAIASVYRASFRLSEKMDRHARLSATWSEVFLDMNRLLAAIRQEGCISAVRQGQMDELVIRFDRTELQDDPQPDKKLQRTAYDEALHALPVDRRWLPST